MSRRQTVDVLVLAAVTPNGTHYTLGTYASAGGLLRAMERGEADHASGDHLRIVVRRMDRSAARACWPLMFGQAVRR